MTPDDPIKGIRTGQRKADYARQAAESLPLDWLTDADLDNLVKRVIDEQARRLGRAGLAG